MTHKNDGFIENLMKVPAPLKMFMYMTNGFGDNSTPCLTPFEMLIKSKEDCPIYFKLIYLISINQKSYNYNI